MKYNQQQLKAMAHHVLVARRDNDPRYQEFMLIMSGLPLLTPAEIDLRILQMAKDL